MAVEEKIIQEAFRRMLLTLDRMDGRPVVINDWDITNRITQDDRFSMIIETADEFISRQDTLVAVNNFTVKLTLLVLYLEDKQAYDDLRDIRQDVLDLFNSPSERARSAGGLDGIDIPQIDAGTPVLPIYEQYMTPEEMATAIPSIIYQTLLIHCEEF